MRELHFRAAARAIVLDPDDHLLLARFEFPGGTVWITPGGGVDPGETVEDCLRRELREELGLTEFELGPHVWNREHVIPMSTGHDGQRDVIHLVRTERFEPAPAIGWDALRAEYVHELRWWSLDELDAVATDLDIRPGETRFAPRRLAGLLRTLLADGPPDRPIDTGV